MLSMLHRQAGPMNLGMLIIPTIRVAGTYFKVDLKTYYTFWMLTSTLTSSSSTTSVHSFSNINPYLSYHALKRTQNAPFCGKKKYGEGYSPLPRSLPIGEGDIPSPIPTPRRMRRLDTCAFGAHRLGYSTSKTLRRLWVRTETVNFWISIQQGYLFRGPHYARLFHKTADKKQK